MSIFDPPSIFDLPPEKPVAKSASQQDLLLQRASKLPLEELRTEVSLRETSMWIPYRCISPVELTTLFVRTYNDVALSLLHLNTDIPISARNYMKATNRYLRPEEYLTPWQRIDKQGRLVFNPRWAHWKTARRTADRYGLIYEDYCYGYLLATIHRGKERWPLPNQLFAPKILGSEPDGRPDWTVFGYVNAKYASAIKTTDDPFFRANAYAGHPLQDLYVAWLRSEVLRLYGPTSRGDRAWGLLKEAGRVNAALALNAAA